MAAAPVPENPSRVFDVCTPTAREQHELVRKDGRGADHVEIPAYRVLVTAVQRARRGVVPVELNSPSRK